VASVDRPYVARNWLYKWETLGERNPWPGTAALRGGSLRADRSQAYSPSGKRSSARSSVCIGSRLQVHRPSPLEGRGANGQPRCSLRLGGRASGRCLRWVDHLASLPPTKATSPRWRRRPQTSDQGATARRGTASPRLSGRPGRGCSAVRQVSGRRHQRQRCCCSAW
jgi:hypothetical protein